MLDNQKILDIIGYSMIQNSNGIFIPQKEENTTVSIQYNEPENEPEIDIIKAIEKSNEALKSMEECINQMEKEIANSFKPLFLTDIKAECRPMSMCNFMKPIITDYLPIFPLLSDGYEMNGYKKSKKKDLFLKIFCIKCFKKRKMLKRDFKNKVIKCKKCGGYIKKKIFKTEGGVLKCN